MADIDLSNPNLTTADLQNFLNPQPAPKVEEEEEVTTKPTKKIITLEDQTRIEFDINTSDEEIEQKLKEDYPEIYAPRQAPDSTIGTFLSRGVDSLQMHSLDYLAAQTEALGFKDTSKYLDYKAGQQRRQMLNKPVDNRSIMEAEGLGETFDAVQQIIAETIPSTASIIGGAATGAAIGSVVPFVGTTFGGLVGAFLGGSALQTGVVRENVKEELRAQGLPDTNTGSAGIQLKYGAAGGALETAGALISLGPVLKPFIKKFGAKATTKQTSKVLGVDEKIIEEVTKAVGQSSLKAAAKGAGKQALVGVGSEGLTEAGQEVLTAIGTDVALGREPRSLAELEDYIISAGLSGMIAGGFFGTVSGGVGGYYDNSQRQKKQLALDEEDRKKQEERKKIKTPAPLQENQSITFIDIDGTRRTANVDKINRDPTDKNTVINVDATPNEGPPLPEGFLVPEQIIDEFSSVPDATYESSQLKKTSDALKKAQEEKRFDDVEKLQTEVTALRQQESYQNRTRLGLPVQSLDEAAFVLANRVQDRKTSDGNFIIEEAPSLLTSFTEEQAKDIRENGEQSKTAQGLINEANQQRARQKNLYARLTNARNVVFKDKESLQDKAVFNAVYSNVNKETFTIKDVENSLGLELSNSKKELQNKINTLIENDVLEVVGTVSKKDLKDPSKITTKNLLRAGKNFSQYSPSALTQEAAVNFLKNVNPTQGNIEILNRQDPALILKTAQQQIKKNYFNTNLKNSFDKIKDQVYLDSVAKDKTFIDVLNEPGFQQGTAQQQQELLQNLKKINIKKQEAIPRAEGKGTQPSVMTSVPTYKTVLNLGGKPIEVTQDELDTGQAIRGKTVIPLEEGDLLLNNKGQRVSGTNITKSFTPATDILMEEGSTGTYEARIGKLVNTTPTPKENNFNDLNNFKVFKVFDIEKDQTGARTVFLANRGGVDGTTFELIEAEVFDTSNMKNLAAYKKKLEAKAKRENKTIAKQRQTKAVQGLSPGEKPFGFYPRSEKIEKMFGFKFVEINSDLMSEEDVIKTLKKIAKGFGLKPDEYTALSMGGEVELSIAQPPYGTAGWYNRASKQLRAGGYGTETLSEATLIHELGHAIDNFLGVNYGKTGGFDAFKEASIKAMKEAKIRSKFLMDNLDFLGTAQVEFISHGTFKPRTSLNQNARKAWESLHSFIMNSNFYKEALKKDQSIQRLYYSMPTESFARLLQTVMSKNLGFNFTEQNQPYNPQGNELVVGSRLVQKLFKSFVKDKLVNDATGETITIFKARIESEPKFQINLKKNVRELQDLTRKLLGTDKVIQFIPTTLKTNEVTDVNRIDDTGYYVRGVTFGDMAQVSLAFDNADYTTIHESFHIAEEIGLINPTEIKFLDTQTKNLKDLILQAQAEQHPTLSKINTDVLFENSREIRAYALEAYKYLSEIRKTGIETKGPLNTLLNKIVNFFRKVKNWFDGNGFYSFQAILDDFLYGKYAKSDQELMEIYKDRPYDITNPLFAHAHSFTTPAQDFNTGIELQKQAIKFEQKVKPIQNPDSLDEATIEQMVDQLKELSIIERNIIHPSTLANRYPDTFGILWSALESQRQLASRIEDRALSLAKPFLSLKPTSSSYKKIAKVLEITDYYIGTLPTKNSDGTMTLRGVAPIPGRENSSVNFQEETVLNKEETKMYEGVREALDGIFDQSMLAFLAALDIKYTGTSFSLDEMIVELKKQQLQKQKEGKVEEAKIRGHGIDVLTQAKNDRHAGYFPRTRTGAVGFIVKNSNDETVHFETIPEKLIRLNIKKPRVDKEKRTEILERIKQKFPESSGFKVIDTDLTEKNQTSLMEQLSVLEKVEHMSTSPTAAAEIKSILNDLRKKTTDRTFLKFIRTRSDKNITGFLNERNEGVYHSQALLNYIQSGSTFAASVQSAPAINGTMSYLEKIATDTNIKTSMIQYMKDQIDYVRDPADEARILKSITFLSFLGVNPSSALLNLTQIPQVTAPLMASLGGIIKGPAALSKAMKDAFKLSKLKDINEYFYNPDKIKDADFLTVDEKDYLRGLFARGVVTPIRNIDAGGKFNMETENMLINSGYGNLLPSLRKGMTFMGSLFGGVEQYNRIASALVGYRMFKNNKKFRDNLNEYKVMTRYKNVETLTPELAGEMLVFDTQFLMGKENRPTIARGIDSQGKTLGALGAFGPVTTQFLTFVGQFIENYFRNVYVGTTGIGVTPIQRKIAAVTAVYATTMIVMFGGFLGLPFADTLRELYKRLSKTLTGTETDIEIVLREMLQESIGTNLTDSLLRGFPRRANIDLSQRAAFGHPLGIDVLNNELSWLFGPFGGLVAQTGQGIIENFQEGKPFKAITQIIPLGIRNVADAIYYYPTEGVQTGTGRTLVPPEDIKIHDMFVKFLGFTPTDVAQERELVRASRYLTTRDRAKRDRYTRKMSDFLAASYRARVAGDMSKSINMRKKFDDLVKELAEYNRARPVEEKIIIQPDTIRNRLAVELYGINDEVSLRYVPKTDRAAQQNLRKLYFSD